MYLWFVLYKVFILSSCNIFNCFAAIIEPLPTNEEAQDYLIKHINPTLLKGLTALCKRKPAEPVVR